MALAPLLGLMPQSATKFLLVKMQSITSWIKMDDDRFSTVTRLTPLDVIDGIDYTTRFRLEECGIYDIQNLATYNPILLHIESPYGIYQTVDWVGQAQLCNVVGLDKFLLLRQMNVRTVFDLERALDYKTKAADGIADVESPDQFDKIYAGIIFAATDAMRTVGKISGTVPFTVDYVAPAAPVLVPQPAPAPQPAAVPAQPLPPVDPSATVTEPQPVASQPDIAIAGIDAYCKWALKIIVADPATTKRCMEHLMGWIADDLHVRRLRRIWQEMSDDLGPRAIRLDAPRTVPTKVD